MVLIAEQDQFLVAVALLSCQRRVAAEAVWALRDDAGHLAEHHDRIVRRAFDREKVADTPGTRRCCRIAGRASAAARTRTAPLLSAAIRVRSLRAVRNPSG